MESEMNDKSWKQRSEGVHQRFVARAQASGKLRSEDEVIHFLALAICGEAGELANLIKKKWRGDEIDDSEIVDEMADIRIYLEHLARLLNVDLDRVCDMKVDIVSERLTMKGA